MMMMEHRSIVKLMEGILFHSVPNFLPIIIDIGLNSQIHANRTDPEN
jgi:hypothetical protein